jgi:glycosyltransferase involved in cell wall biosynthesis
MSDGTTRRDRSMKVLHIVHWPRSGIGVVIRDIVRHRSPDIHHTVLCLATGEPLATQIEDAGADVHRGTHDHPSWLQSCRFAQQLLRGMRPDIVHSHSLTPRLLANVVAARVKHVTTVHTAYLYFKAAGLRNVVKRGLERVAALGVDGPYACASADVAASLPFASMRRRAVVITNGVDIAYARQQASSAGRRFLGDPLLVAIGRLDWEKGFDRLLHAVGQLRTHFPRIHVVICGEGRERPRLTELMHALGLQEHVSIAGHVAEPMPILASATAFVSSSLQEGFALTVAEALALGVPVIATPVAGAASILTHGETGFLARGFEAERIADAIAEALRDGERLRRIGDAGRRYANAHLDVRRCVQRYETLYRAGGP